MEYQIDFVRLPDGKVVPAPEIHGEVRDLKIRDNEQVVELSVKAYPGSDYKETCYIADLTDREHEKLLQDRRLHFFSAKTR